MGDIKYLHPRDYYREIMRKINGHETDICLVVGSTIGAEASKLLQANHYDTLGRMTKMKDDLGRIQVYEKSNGVILAVIKHHSVLGNIRIRAALDALLRHYNMMDDLYRITVYSSVDDLTTINHIFDLGYVDYVVAHINKCAYLLA